MVTALVVMAAIVSALLAIYQSSASPRSALERRLGGVISESTGAELTVASFESMRARRIGTTPIISSLLSGKSWTEDLALQLERGDIKLTVSEFITVRVLFALMACIISLVLLGVNVFGFVGLVLGGVAGYALPGMYLNRAKDGRLRKLNEQLPDALVMLANSLKAGFGLMQSMDLASRELSHPIATDFRRMLQEINVGASTEEALQNLATRSGSADLDIVVTAMLIQQSTGGNLAEILDNVAHTMRERIRIRGEIKTLTTQGIMTGFIIGGLPVFLGIALYAMNPEYTGLLFTHVIGNAMLAGAVMLELFGIFLIKRILAIEV